MFIRAKERFISLLKEQFNRGVRYKGQRMKWDTVIQEKTSELARFLTGKTGPVDFLEPCPKLDRLDSKELRKRIQSLTSQEAKRLGIGKSTLHYIRRNASSEKPFKLHEETRRRLLA
ncbi:MAG: CRISPR-associated protein Cas1 [Candidatus Bathyarchaeia archaeon]